jgi:signal transduction histidine kinase
MDASFYALRARVNSATWYAAAVLVAAVALLVSRTLIPVLGDYVSYVAVFPAIAFSALYCGLGPSILATILALAGIKYWSLTPVHTLDITTGKQALGMFAVLIASAAIVAMGESRRRQNSALRRAQGELEERVKQRTADLDLANQGLRELTARLMKLQDDERRRIARELHDSVGQALAALSMNLTTVGTDLERLSQTARTVADSAVLVQEMNKEVRTISHLLHPPLLDEAGLASALRWYIEGFSQRSKIQVELEAPQDFGRVPQELETAVFRIVQECLTNIHRHSNSSVALVRLTRSSSELRVRVEDRGTGIRVEKLNEVTTSGAPGVGIRGMRERMRQLGGSLEVSSNGDGTTVEARLPIDDSSLAAA